MLLERSRDELSRARKSEIAQSEIFQRERLREFWDIYAALAEGRDPLDSPHPNLTAEVPQPSEEESRFLAAADINKGLSFNERLYTFPSLPDLAPSAPREPSHASDILSVPHDTSSASVTTEVPPPTPIAKPGSQKGPAPATFRLPSTTPIPAQAGATIGKSTTELSPPVALSQDPYRLDTTPETSRNHGEQSGTRTAAEQSTAPREPIPEPLNEQVDVVTQGDKVKDGIQAEVFSGEKDRKEDVRRGSLVTNHADLASSPSSTVGPYSAHTPRPIQQSPDTSPEQESFNVDSQAMQRRLSDHASPKDTSRQHVVTTLQPKGYHQTPHSPAPLTPADQQQLSEEQDRRLTAVSDQPASGRPDQDVYSEQRRNEANLEMRKHPTPPPDVDMPDATDPIVSKHVDHPQSVTDESHNETTSSLDRLRPFQEDLVIKQIALTPDSGTAAPLSQTNLRNAELGSHKKKVQKRRQSTVIFPRKNAEPFENSVQLYSDDYAALKGASLDDRKDYLLGLFTHQAHLAPRPSVTLDALLGQAHKSVSTTDFSASIRDNQDYKILKRVYQLQNANKWSLRQMEKPPEPSRPLTHDDFLLAQMKWMRTDFKEERKWKHTMARTLAEWCAEFVSSSAEHRASLQIKRSCKRPRDDVAREMDADVMTDAPTPDLVASGANETEAESLGEDDRPDTPGFYVNPSSLFEFGFDDVVMHMKETPANEHLLREIPEYDHMAVLHHAEWGPVEPTILPVSKYVTGKIVSKSHGPPRKRSRYEYEPEDDLSDYSSKRPTPEHSRPSTPGRRLHRNDLPPEKTDVALFNYENKHVRDRVHSNSVFRPPSEFPMPTVAFLASRTPSQWHWDEDQKLRSLVKEFQFNWSLVSSELALPSVLTSGTERRTPWECFERWQQLDGLPTEMSRTQYFRTWAQRQEDAQRINNNNIQMHQQQLQQQGASAPNVTPRRRIQPFRVERRKDNRYLMMVDAFRKKARKNETLAHKSQEAAKAAQMRKQHEPQPPKATMHTPLEFSRLKYEREVAAEKREQFRLAQQQAAMMQRQQATINAARAAQGNNSAQMRGGASMPSTNGTNINGSPTSQNASATSGNNLQNRVQGGQALMQGNMSNGTNVAGMNMGMNGMPQAQMQMPSQQRVHTQESLRLQMQQRQLHANQHQQYQLQQQLNNPNNLANAHLAGTNMALQNTPNMMANMATMAAKQGNANGTANGNGSNPMNGVARMSGSPQMNMASPQVNGGRPLSSGHVPAIQQLTSRLRQAHPDWTAEQIQQKANEELTSRLRTSQIQRQQAMHAAAGNGAYQNPGTMSNGTMMGSASPPNAQQFNQQAYLANMVRNNANSQSQTQASSPNMGATNTASRSATPQNPHQQQQQLQQSPGMQQAQMARQ